MQTMSHISRLGLNRWLSLGLLAIAVAVAPLSLKAESEPEAAGPAPFYPVWRLLSQEQKSQYLAGYVQGWKDASKVTDIAIQYVKENPQEAVSGLQKLKVLYDLSDVSPSLLVSQIDRFFIDPKHQSASLSLAISSVRGG